MKVEYQEIEDYLDWTKQKAELKFNTPNKSFPILYNCIYWAFMGCNIGSEEGKHRPVLVTRTYKNSPICTVLPLTTQRLNDGKAYHVDLELINSSVLCEQMRIIDTKRLEKPMYLNGKICTITQKDWNAIDAQVRKQYLLSQLPAQKTTQNNTSK